MGLFAAEPFYKESGPSVGLASTYYWMVGAKCIEAGLCGTLREVHVDVRSATHIRKNL